MRSRATTILELRTTPSDTKMNRALATFFFFTGWLVFSHGQAEAMTEFCPATIQLRAVGGVPAASPAQIYGFELDAAGPRTVMATLYVDTKQGWFTADVPNVQLTEKERTYQGDFIEYQDHEWASPTMYLQFPQSVVIRRAWLHSAQSQGDTFGWQSQGPVECLPSAIDLTAPVTTLHGNSTMVQSKDLDSLSKSPGPQSTVIMAKSSPTLESVDCTQPFQPPSIVEQEQPDYPDVARENGAGRRVVVVTVAIPADGPASDFWVSGPSDVAALNAAAFAAARGSTFKNAVAYCQAVPSFFYFDVTFEPG